MKTNHQKKKLSNFKKLLIANSVLAIFVIAWVVISLCILLSLQIPQRTNIAFMDQQMLNDGEGAFIIYACVFIFLLVPTYLSLLITSAIIVYKFFYKEIILNYGIILNDSWYSKIIIGLFCISYILLPVIFVWFFYIKPEKWSIFNNKLQTIFIKKSNRKIWWILYPIIIVSLIIIFICTLLFSSFFPNLKNVKYRYDDLQQAYTISENNPNTIILYFDRGFGLMWNQLLMVDYLMFKNNHQSFIELFPEFTSYINTLSQSMVTNSSNPSINGSWYMQPIFKNINVIDPFYNCDNKQLSYDQYFLNSYKNMIGMFNKHQYTNFNLLNPPYYGKKTYQLNANAYALQNDLINDYNHHNFYPKNYTSNYAINQIHSLDVTEIVKTLGLDPTCSKTDEINFLHYFCASQNTHINNPLNNQEFSYGTNLNLKVNNHTNYINLRTQKNLGSTFSQFYFQTTHENYQYVKNNQYVSSNNHGGINYDNVDEGQSVVTDPTPNNELISIWYAIQKTKRFLIYLKNLPANDKKRPWIKNQYDNCNIYFISDHGTPVVNKKDYFIKINQYLINQKVMQPQQMDYLFNKLFNHSEMSFTFWNNFFMRKPAKYSINSWNQTNLTPKSFFNQEQVICSSDFMPIIEADLMKQNFNTAYPNNSRYTFNQANSWYFDKNINNLYQMKAFNKKDQDLIQQDLYNNFILNPLSNPQLMNKRTLPLYYTNWLYINNATKFDIYYKYYFTNEFPGGVFNIKNFKLAYKN